MQLIVTLKIQRPSLYGGEWIAIVDIPLGKRVQPDAGKGVGSNKACLLRSMVLILPNTVTL